MALYYFDIYDGTKFRVDNLGSEFSDLETVQLHIMGGLADLVRDVAPGNARGELAIIVRDEQSRHVLKTIMVFEIEFHVSN
jgi:hypothetical protein